MPMLAPGPNLIIIQDNCSSSVEVSSRERSRRDRHGFAYAERLGQLIPAERRDELLFEQQAADASRQNLQHFVAGAVSARSLTLLEPIEIDGDQRDFAPSLVGESDLAREIVVEAGPDWVSRSGWSSESQMAQLQ